MFNRIRIYMHCLCVLCCMEGWALQAVPVDTVGFVRTSLFVVSSGDKVYSVWGHAALRMQCPTHRLDYCFSCELPEVGWQGLSFFSGGLKTGFIYAPTEEYCRDYVREGRTVTEFVLNLTDGEKRRLWKVLDERVADGLTTPCDYLNRGCAIECARMVDAVLLDEEIRYSLPPELEKRVSTRRRAALDCIPSYPWEALFWTFMAGTEADEEVSLFERLVVPGDLAEAWQHACLVDTNGERRPLIISSSVLYQGNGEKKDARMVPIIVMVLWLIAVLSVTVCERYNVCRRITKWMDVLLLALQTVLGLFLFYMLCFSTQAATAWNWFFIPFNPLPLCVLLVGCHGRIKPAARSCIYLFYACVTGLFVLVSPWLYSVLSPAWSLLVASMTIRCIHHYKALREKKNICV